MRLKFEIQQDLESSVEAGIKERVLKDLNNKNAKKQIISMLSDTALRYGGAGSILGLVIEAYMTRYVEHRLSSRHALVKPQCYEVAHGDYVLKFNKRGNVKVSLGNKMVFEKDMCFFLQTHNGVIPVICEVTNLSTANTRKRMTKKDKKNITDINLLNKIVSGCSERIFGKNIRVLSAHYMLMVSDRVYNDLNSNQQSKIVQDYENRENMQLVPFGVNQSVFRDLAIEVVDSVAPDRIVSFTNHLDDRIDLEH